MSNVMRTSSAGHEKFHSRREHFEQTAHRVQKSPRII